MHSGQSARRLEAQYATDRYLPVFLLLLVALGTATFAESSRFARAVVILAVVGAVVGTMRATGSTPRRMNVVLIGAALLSAAVIVATLLNITAVTGAVALIVAATLGYAAFLLLRRIFEQRRIGIREVVASLDAYIQIAMLFAFVYGAVASATTESFFTDGRTGQIGDFVYFSVVTITTLGYGDLAPATNVGRSLVILETLLGQILVVVLVAYLVGSIGRERPTRRHEE